MNPLPANEQAERAILGAILMDNACIPSNLLPEEFSLDAHARIFTRILELRRLKRQADLITLTEEFIRRNEVLSIGSIAYLASLTEGLPRNIALLDYVRIVKEKAALRAIIAACQEAIDAATEQRQLPVNIASKLRRALPKES